VFGASCTASRRCLHTYVLQGSTPSLRRLIYVAVGVATPLSVGGWRLHSSFHVGWAARCCTVRLLICGALCTQDIADKVKDAANQTKGAVKDAAGAVKGKVRITPYPGRILAAAVPRQSLLTCVLADSAAEALHTATLPAVSTCSLDTSSHCHLHTVALS
jgi:hypothetical protein